MRVRNSENHRLYLLESQFSGKGATHLRRKRRLTSRYQRLITPTGAWLGNPNESLVRSRDMENIRSPPVPGYSFAR